MRREKDREREGVQDKNARRQWRGGGSFLQKFRWAVKCKTATKSEFRLLGSGIF
jgi:hypothetical protein